jgi:hypothetical protein
VHDRGRNKEAGTRRGWNGVFSMGLKDREDLSVDRDRVQQVQRQRVLLGFDGFEN